MVDNKPVLGWSLDDAEKSHARAPNTFHIPSREERVGLQPGDVVKLIFRFSEPGSFVERIWVNILEAKGGRYFGNLTSRPAFSTALRAGGRVEFGPEHVCATFILVTDPRHPDFEATKVFPVQPGEPLYYGRPLSHWLELLRGRDAKPRYKALDALHGIGTEGQEALPTLLALLDDGDKYVSVPAAQLLSQLGLTAVPALTSRLESENANARWGAVYALGEIGLPTCLPDIAARLHDDDADVREAVVNALEKLNGSA